MQKDALAFVYKSNLLQLVLGCVWLSVAQQNIAPNADQAKRREQYRKEHPPQSSVGLIPLIDLGSGTYKGQQGGLYAGGENVPPPQHLQSGVEIAATIVPLDAKGSPSQDGKIVLMSIGFSNPSIEFPAFQKRVADDADVNPHVATVNGCVGSQAAHSVAESGGAVRCDESLQLTDGESRMIGGVRGYLRFSMTRHA